MSRKIVYGMMVSLDGFVARPDGSLDWVNVDDELHTFVNRQQADVDTYLHGRRMYELMAAYWPTADQAPDAPDFIVDFARIWRDMPKLVFSKSLERVDWNAQLVREVDAGAIRALKAQPGKNIDVGGAELAAHFMRLGLIDEYWLYVNPVILGNGMPMFPALDEMTELRLLETRTFGSGVVLLRYADARSEA